MSRHANKEIYEFTVASLFHIELTQTIDVMMLLRVLRYIRYLFRSIRYLVWILVTTYRLILSRSTSPGPLRPWSRSEHFDRARQYISVGIDTAEYIDLSLANAGSSSIVCASQIRGFQGDNTWHTVAFVRHTPSNTIHIFSSELYGYDSWGHNGRASLSHVAHMDRVKEILQSRSPGYRSRDAAFVHGAGLLGAQQCGPFSMEILVRVVKAIVLRGAG